MKVFTKKYTKVVLLVFMQGILLCAKAQNIVSNGDFEIYYTNTSTGITFPVGWIAYASPDYYNSASGYQQDCCGGNGLIGEYMMCSFTVHGDDSCREYIETKLIDTLKTGYKYLASMYVNRADYFDYSLASIGMLFTDTLIPSPPYPQFFVINTIPQIKNNIVLGDTANWVLVQDTFIAVGNETYLTIGNFNTTATSDTVKSNGTWVYSGSAYYNIDGVSVYNIDGTCNNLWDAGFDKYIFTGDSIRLGAINTDSSTYTWINSIGGTTYLSSNTDARPWSTPSVTTTYYVTKTCPNNIVFLDTVTVYIQQPLGVNQSAKNNLQMSIFPNPNNGNMFVDYKITTDAIMEIVYLNGNLVGTYNLPVTDSHIEIKNDKLQSGVYLYRIISNNNMVKFGKIVIIK
jgi:hypothetical protein